MMEMYESFSRAMMRRKYRRLEGATGFPVQRKRVKVAHLKDEAGGRRRVAHRMRLRCFRLRLLVPGRLMALLKIAAMKVMQVGKAGDCTSRSAIAGVAQTSTPQRPILLLPRNLPLRSSGNDAIDEVWFQNALRRSIAEGRLVI